MPASSPQIQPSPGRRISFNFAGDGENVRATAPLCAIIVLLIAVAIPLWVCAFSASAAPWMEPDVMLHGGYRMNHGSFGEFNLDMEKKTGASGSVAHHKRRSNTGMLSFITDKYEFALVTDLDKRSRDPSSFTWQAYLKKGVLKRTSNTIDSNFTVVWGETLTLQTHTSTKNRSMELSELVRFNRNLFAMCDMTGIIFKVMPDSGRVFQRFAIADGNGDEPKPFKIEWATVKDNLLWVGSVGKEIDDTRRPAEWVLSLIHI
eukprot:TRINITY_DN8848_c0_g1_i3.p2 TRINITY_DN8848_c0_g1~~TRINITY_DN8848_c0_g1_i3.p2  ORF type:complete len:261 (-),score=70.99 TRINITY_DN8848_c0_g1_i3:50-832(-)